MIRHSVRPTSQSLGDRQSANGCKSEAMKQRSAAPPHNEPLSKQRAHDTANSGAPSLHVALVSAQVHADLLAHEGLLATYGVATEVLVGISHVILDLVAL